MKSKKIFYLISLVAFFTCNISAVNAKTTKNLEEVNQMHFYNFAVLQALNKTTAKTSILEMKMDEKINFGQLRIIAHKCWKAPLDQKPENKILLEVFENRFNDELGDFEENRIFYGWMFSSSPSISSIEHPIYDLAAIKCINK